jgi:NPCBM/NEW2 domain
MAAPTLRSLSASCLVLTVLALAQLAQAGGNAPERAVEITAKAAPWTVLGSRVAITGSVKPHAAGLGLTLEQRAGGVWTAVDSKSVTGATFSFLTKPKDTGRAIYRVVAAKGGSYSGDSPAVVVNVFRWSYLSDLYARPFAGDLITEPNTSHGVEYDHAVTMDAGCYNAWNGDAWVDYILDRKYELFTATVGLDDAAPTGATASYSVFGGGKILASGSLTNGTTDKIRVPLDGMYRVRLRINVPDPTGAAGCGTNLTQVVFGDAQVLGP